MEFDALKRKMLSKLGEEGADEPVMQYLDLINAHKDYVTSSSCYGRIILIDLPTTKKPDSQFLEKWHRKISPEEVWRALQNVKGESVWFKCEALILHVSCRDVESAKKFIDAKAAAGMKRGGIFSIAPGRVQIELEGTHKFACPVKQGKDLLVNEDYVRVLVEKANEKVDRNIAQWERFAEELKKL